MGAAIANRLVEDGADVAISYAASAEKAEANVRQFEVKGVRAAAFKADQSRSRADIAALGSALRKWLGNLDF